MCSIAHSTQGQNCAPTNRRKDAIKNTKHQKLKNKITERQPPNWVNSAASVLTFSIKRSIIAVAGPPNNAKFSLSESEKRVKANEGRRLVSGETWIGARPS